MSNLLATLMSSAGALRTYDQVLETAQNNVANASTPGYVKQRQMVQAMPFDPQTGLQGGVRAGDIQSARNQYAEQAVRRQTILLGAADQRVQTLSALQSLFDISGKSGVPYALNNLFQGFSAWAQSPGDAIARQTVIDRAQDLSNVFNQASDSLNRMVADTDAQLRQTVDQVNGLLGRLQEFNRQIMAGARNDAGLDAQLHSTLEELSQYVPITAITQTDGSVTVLLDGQAALLVGDQQYSLAVRQQSPPETAPAYPDGRLPMGLFGSDGADLTQVASSGKVGALLDIRNRLLPSYLGDINQPGDLNLLAKQFATRVNQILESGVVSEGDPPVAGIPLFTFDQPNDTNVAHTLAVNSAITPDLLAAIQVTPDKVANGIPLALSALADPQQDQDTIGGASFTEYYGGLVGRLGNELNRAESDQQIQQSSVAQAKSLREQMCGVSLDEEAVILIQFQRAYQANSRFLTTINQLSEDILNILRP